MKLWNKIIDGGKIVYRFLGIEVYKTLKSSSNESHFLLKIEFLKKKISPEKTEYYILGIPLYAKKDDSFHKIHSQEFLNYILNQQLDKSKFVPITDKPYKRHEDDVKLIAYYLPQYYHFPINDEWHGKGFTEWTNVTKAQPQFVGHEQPKLPIDVGFYNLETTTAMKRQIELAKMYGIYGWCFYYYWFSGERVMEKPVLNFLNDKSLDMPFCLFWANENWTRNWGEKDSNLKTKLYDANIQDGDSEKFMRDALPLMKDSRYIKINNKPVLIIYKIHSDNKEQLKQFIAQIRAIARKNGFNDLYLMNVRDYKSSTDSVSDCGFDALVEFPPVGITRFELKTADVKIMNPLFCSKVWDMRRLLTEDFYIDNIDFPIFRGCFPSWDNASRKGYSGGSHANVYQTTPDLYKKWLKNLILWTKEHKNKEEQFVFINAWNEWAEGAHLEPDHRYGYAYLQATKEAVTENGDGK
ncbi:MAG: glycoside hydrolase family 99-like domain-containing protein [Endomicrobia bacterium]|nr:glycoside hydrolase family 99-like domain-containing protein [Endomicrobiia bacterium]MCL2506252.1 glycoside hydrolase family 99-like domain-containing protein [Endomicrobiia bacterium]